MLHHQQIKFLTVKAIKSGKLTLATEKGETLTLAITETQKPASFFTVGKKYNFFYEKNILVDVEEVIPPGLNVVEVPAP